MSREAVRTIEQGVRRVAARIGAVAARSPALLHLNLTAKKRRELVLHERREKAPKSKRRARKPRQGRSLLGESLEPRWTLSAGSAAATVVYRNGPANTGLNATETTLTPANVNSDTFGRLFTTTLDGQVYAQPLTVPNLNITAGANPGVHDVVFAATQNDSLYAIDGKNGKILWSRSLLNGLPGAKVTPVPDPDVGTPEIGPVIGVMSTPAIDLNSGTLYAVANTKEVLNGVAHYVVRLHAVQISTGAEIGSTVIGDTSLIDSQYVYNSGPTTPGTGFDNVNGVIHFNAMAALQRAAVTLANGRVYVAFASYEGMYPGHGWVLSYDASTLQPDGVFNATPSGNLGDIWQSGGPLAVDGQGYLYVVISNGTFDTQLNADGFPAQGDYGDSVVKLSPDLHVVDYFTPYNQQQLADLDLDLGSGGPTLLPDSVGSPAHPHLMVVEGKEGTIYLIDRDQMGHYDPNGNYVVQELTKVTHGLFGNLGFFNNTLYVSTPGDNAKTFTFVPGQAHIDVSSGPASQSADAFGFPGSTPTISANGSSDGIVWAISAKGKWNGLSIPNGTLRAYDASTGYATELWDSNQNAPRDQLPSYTKFSVPAVQNGRVYVGTSQFIVGYGLLSEGQGSQGYVGGLYSQLLHRSPDPAGENNWNTLLGNTARRDFLVQGIMSAAEYKQQLVQGWYQQYLHREADAPGLAFLTGQLQAGARDEFVLEEILSSREYLASSGGSAADWAARIYQDMFQRTASAAEIAYWTKLLAATDDNFNLAAQSFLQSDEYRLRVLDSYYTSLLGRSVDQGASQYWLNVLKQGVAEEIILANILTSSEYLVASQS